MCTVLPKSIKIFLIDGTITGMKSAEIVNHTIHAVSCPNKSQTIPLKQIEDYPEAHKPGVYFLFGTDDETDKQIVYIGEAENISERLTAHRRTKDKDFWNGEVIFFIGKDENITKAHIGYLESRLVEIAKKNSIERGYTVKNTQIPKLKSLPKSDIAAMQEFLADIKLLMGVLGHKLLEDVVPNLDKTEAQSSTTQTIQKSNQMGAPINNLELFLEAKKITARAIQTNEGIVVLEGSEAVLENKSKYLWHEQLRAKLILDKVLKLVDDKYIFQSSFLFKTASSAAAIVLGNSANGLTSWKNADGKDLKTIENERMGAEN
jgi:hypothetical protein